MSDLTAEQIEELSRKSKCDEIIVGIEVRQLCNMARELIELRAKVGAEQWVDLNLNESVRYKLTDLGKQIHRRHYDELNEFVIKRGGKMPHEYSAPKVDENGWSTEQLWCLFKDYGPSIHLGCHAPFETTIQVKMRQTSEKAG